MDLLDDESLCWQIPYVVSDHRFLVATKEAGFYASHFAQKSYVDFGLELRVSGRLFTYGFSGKVQLRGWPKEK